MPSPLGQRVLTLRGQNAVFYDITNFICKYILLSVYAEESDLCEKLIDSHTILCECANLVSAEYSSCTQRLHCRNFARKHSVLGISPAPQSQEDCKDD
jgi:hypothetical protein